MTRDDLSDKPKGQPLESRKHHVPYAQMKQDQQEEEAPGADEHAAAGQGISG